MENTNEEIDEMLFCKKGVINEEEDIYLPKNGSQVRICLESAIDSFIIDVVKKGHKKKKFTIQLRLSSQSSIISRLDMYGKPHFNSEKNHPYSKEYISTPHVHVANKLNGYLFAYPINDSFMLKCTY